MNSIKISKSRLVFQIFNYIIIAILALSCMVPILNLLATSFSSSQAIIQNRVGLLPVEFNLKAYEYVIKNTRFWESIKISTIRVVVGVPLNVMFAIMAAYPLSKEDYEFGARKFYVAILLTAMLFNGGLMPTYYLVSKLGIIDTIWSLTLPGALPIFSCIIMMNFFRGIPKELEESAKIDGSGQWRILFQIFIPLSKPSIATITLFSLIGHWNSWFDGLIYSNHTENYPLQSYLQTLVVSTTEALTSGDLKEIMDLTQVNDTNMKAAQIFISIIPLMIVYPFMQKHFTKGLTLGSVKG